MKRCVFHRRRTHQRLGLSVRQTRARSGFTLLEMCVVLVIMGLLLGVTMPAMHSAFTEQTMRGDSRQLALMVRTAMLQSEEQRRPYVIDLSGTSVSLHSQAPGSDSGDSTVAGFALDPSNKLLVPNPDKADEWLPLPSASWIFQPGDLCHVPRVRILRGDAWLEMSFNALTGNVEDETTYIP